MKNWLLSLGMSLTALVAVGATPSLEAAKDSIKVVKGQVSDYYIAVHEEHQLKGRVTDEQGNPLEGATVMWFASPVHINTDAQGRFELTGQEDSRHLYVYYPGMEFADMMLEPLQSEVTVVMEPKGPSTYRTRGKAEATRWYDPEDYNPQTFCNPLNISYNYEPYNPNSQHGGSFRSSADPMAVTYGDEFFLFSTNQDGFHTSKDLSKWDFVRASFKRKPADDDMCAPAAFVSGDTLFYTGSTYYGLPVWYSTSPKEGKWRRVSDRNSLPSWDPWLFLDDDGRLYLYYGSSNEFPIKAVELSRHDLEPISKIHDVLMLHPEEHGWERFGMNNDDEVTLRPFMEGAAMTKHNGKYYLQYGGPGTEFKIYADGVYVGDSPLGPFTYQKHNPMSYKPGGFVMGSGHGGTFKDFQDNYWHVSTCMLSLKYKFERRIGLYPAGFDEDGVMYSSAAFGDYPTLNANHDIKDPTERFAGWMLLSYQKPVKVSASGENSDPSVLTDNNIRTYWTAPDAAPGQWVELDLLAPKTVNAIQVNYYDNNSNQFDRADDVYYQYRIYASDNGEDWTLVVDKSQNWEDAPHDYIELREPLNARYLKLENLHMPHGDFCLSDIRVFGKDENVALPGKVKGFKVARNKKDVRNSMITWQPQADAYGYNIYYGTAPDKMYNAITVMGENEYDMRGLDVGTPYWFAIEALNEAGRSPMSEILMVK